MRSANRKLFCIFISTLLLMQFACGIFSAPVRSIPVSEVFVEIHQVPEVLERGEVGTFALKTALGNICLGAIIYDKVGSSESEVIDLPELEANEDGICHWNWEAPLDAKTGTAVFRAAVEQNSIHDSISPYTFCIEKCPWGSPEGQP